MARRAPRRSARPDAPPRALLWAPWRSAYVSKSHKHELNCLFCFGRIGAAARRRRQVLYAGPLALVMLNRYPYSNGHLMVAPRSHVASIELLTPAELAALSRLVASAVERLRATYHPDGLNVGFNLGRAAGAGIADHVHCHVVPRWDGDNNFMPVIGSTRVLPQYLTETYDLLEPLFKTIDTAVS
jgi:ATP adenylyltransferase